MSEVTALISARAQALSREYETIAHNLSNVSTNGYKRRINNFSKLLEEQGALSMDETGYEDKDGNALKYETYDFTQGRMIETGRKLDFALSGKGFFVLETPEDGQLYTRNGMFRVNPDRQLVDANDRLVLGENGPITIPSTVSLDQVTVSPSGTIKADGFPVGRFLVVDFKEEEPKLMSVGMNCFASPDIEPEPSESVTVHQGFQEGSNVQLYEEMVDMMMVTRMYQANMRFSTVGKDTTQSLISVAMG